MNEFATVKQSAASASTQKLEPTDALSARKPEAITLTPSETTSTACGFNWMPWSAISATEKAAMKKVMITQYEAPSVSLLQFIATAIASGSKIQIARHTFFKDKQSSYVVYQEYKEPLSGFKGQIDIVEGLGQSYLWPSASIKQNLCAVQPTNKGKGILTDEGQLIEFMSGLFFDQEYAKFLKATKQPAVGTVSSAINANSRPGAKTPEELAILLLKCLKTNDKVMWMRCMHPDDSIETDEISSQKFDRHRETIASNGVTNWSAVQYSRFTYPLRPMGGSKVDPNKTIPFATVEFTYKNQEFVGRVKIGTFSFYEGRWLVWFCGWPEDGRIERNFGR